MRFERKVKKTYMQTCIACGNGVKYKNITITDAGIRNDKDGATIYVDITPADSKAAEELLDNLEQNGSICV